MLTTTCTICRCPLVGSPDDDDACCEDCTTVNFPPPQDIPLPWWQAVRMSLAPNRDGIRAMAHREDTPHDATPP